MPDPPKTAEERQTRLDVLIEQSRVPAHIRKSPAEAQDHAIQVAEMLRDDPGLDLFGGKLPEHAVPDIFQPQPSRARGRTRRYQKRAGLDMPSHLMVEHPPEADVVNSDEFNEAIARKFVLNSEILSKLNTKMGAATVSFRDLFDEYAVEEVETLQVLLDDDMIAKKGQEVFDFNKRVDDRLLRKALVRELEKTAIEQGFPAERRDIRRAIYLAAMREPEVFRRVIKQVGASYMEVREAASPIPDHSFDVPDAVRSVRNVYSIVPSDLNTHEAAFAKWLDSDKAHRVEWWMRNEDRKPWSCYLFLPSGARFFPDFIVKVRGRSTRDSIALVEVKGSHIMNSDDSHEKIVKAHKVYLRVLWVQQSGDTFRKVSFNRSTNRVLPGEVLDPSDLLATTETR